MTPKNISLIAQTGLFKLREDNSTLLQKCKPDSLYTVVVAEYKCGKVIELTEADFEDYRNFRQSNIQEGLDLGYSLSTLIGDKLEVVRLRQWFMKKHDEVFE